MTACDWLFAIGGYTFSITLIWLFLRDEDIAELKAELAELRAAASPFAECLDLDEITSEERAALAVLLLQEKGE